MSIIFSNIKEMPEQYQDRMTLYNKSVRALDLLRIAIEKMEATDDQRFMRAKQAEELMDTLYTIGNSLGNLYDFRFKELE
jgi:hypothetical protein